jgi:hypothetical protein
MTHNLHASVVTVAGREGFKRATCSILRDIVLHESLLPEKYDKSLL